MSASPAIHTHGLAVKVGELPLHGHRDLNSSGTRRDAGARECEGHRRGPTVRHADLRGIGSVSEQLVQMSRAAPVRAAGAQVDERGNRVLPIGWAVPAST